MPPEIINHAFGRLDTVPREIRDEIYKLGMLDNTLSVCHADISNTNGRIRKPPVINGLPALASASTLIRNEILSDTDITTIRRHRVHIIFNLGKRMATSQPPTSMSTWASATDITVKITVRTIPGGQYSLKEATRLIRQFRKQATCSFPRVDKSMDCFYHRVDLRWRDRL